MLILKKNNLSSHDWSTLCQINMCYFLHRLRKRKNGTISAAGFQLPDHAAVEDLRPWLEGDKGLFIKLWILKVLDILKVGRTTDVERTEREH